MKKISMYDVTIPEFIKAITNIAKCIDKAEAYAKEHDFNVEILMHYRLYPDMFDFISQVRNACWTAVDYAKQITGRGDLVKKDPREETIGELRETILKSLEFLKTVKPEELEGAEDKKMTFYFKTGVYAVGSDFITKFIHPNFYFHITTAYDILRHNGVPIGKDDYIADYGMQQDN